MIWHPRIRPLRCIINQPGPDWIEQNIIPFLLGIFVIAQAMVEEIALPGDSMAASQRVFPKSGDLSHGFFGRKVDDQMKVVRHEYGEFAVPMMLVVVDADRIEHDCAEIGMTKMVVAAWFRAKGDEIIGVRVDPMRGIVVEVLAGCHNVPSTAARDSGGYLLNGTY